MRKKIRKPAYTHNGSFVRSLVLFVRVLPSVMAFPALFIGIMYAQTRCGVYAVFAASAVLLVSIFANIVVPLSRMK